MKKYLKIKIKYLLFTGITLYAFLIIILINFNTIKKSAAIYADIPKKIINIKLPTGYKRIKTKKKSFKTYLRTLPLYPPGTPVHLYNGSLKGNQTAHHSVIALSVGEKNLQQCADAIIRLKAEYHFINKEYNKIKFRITNGKEIEFIKWAKGFRPKITRNKIKWHKRAGISYSYNTFLSYLEFIFIYAGTYSLSKELAKINIEDIQIGDIFIQGNFPGHAIIVMDMAVNKKNPQEKIFLLSQSYMPAQQIHILKNPQSKLSPWYKSSIKKEELITPEWTFKITDLKRFK